MAIFQADGVSEVPRLTSLTALSIGVVQTLLADPAELVTRVHIADIDVVVALAGFAEIT